MGNTCPTESTLVKGNCFDQCQQGYFQDSQGLCLKSCPSGFSQEGVACVRENPAKYSRGNGFESKTECESVNGTVCEKCGSSWYPPCISAYARGSCDICVLKCPDGSVNDVCVTESYIPETSSPRIALSTLLTIGIIMIVLIGVIVGLMRGRQMDVSDLLTGSPDNDAYSALEKITGGRRAAGTIYI